MNWLDGLKPEDIKGDLGIIAQRCGMEVAIMLSRELGGINVYIGQLKSLEAVKKKEYILANFDGQNYKELALATGYTEEQIYRIVAESRQVKKADRQDPLF